MYASIPPLVARFVLSQRRPHGLGTRPLGRQLLACIPWMKISESAQRGMFGKVRAGDVFAVAGWFFLVHLLFLVRARGRLLAPHYRTHTALLSRARKTERLTESRPEASARPRRFPRSCILCT
jgi:hypothetical protein